MITSQSTEQGYHAWAGAGYHFQRALTNSRLQDAHYDIPSRSHHPSIHPIHT